MNKGLKNDRMVEHAMDSIEGGFLWASTPQGKKYWRDVIDNLNIILEMNEKEMPQDKNYWENVVENLKPIEIEQKSEGI